MRPLRRELEGFGAFREASRIEFGDIVFGADTSVSYSANAAGTSGTLVVSDGTHSAQIAT